eukprot:6187325-Pleurochrysis_carterae.AAC.2
MRTVHVRAVQGDRNSATDGDYEERAEVVFQRARWNRRTLIEGKREKALSALFKLSRLLPSCEEAEKKKAAGSFVKYSSMRRCTTFKSTDGACAFRKNERIFP